jgi:hypothetical protein
VLLRALLCSAINDRDPIYTGTDPNTGEDFEGPEIATEVLRMAAYFMTCRAMRDACNSRLSEGQRRRIMDAINEGIATAHHHQYAFDRAWGEGG